MNYGDVRGFTLVEVILALVLSTVTIGVIYQLYLSQVKNQAVLQKSVPLTRSCNFLMTLPLTPALSPKGRGI